MQATDTRWLARAIDSSGDAIVTATVDGIVASWNAGAERLLGFTADEMVGRPLTRLLPPDRVDDEVQRLATVRAGGRVGRYETTCVHKDGTVVDVAVSLSAITDDAGRVVGALEIVRDIGERKLLDARSAEHQRWLASMLTSLSEGGIAVDGAGRITFMNHVAERLTGWARAAATGRHVESVVWLVEEAGRQRVENPAAEAVRQGATSAAPRRALLVSRDGSECPVEATAAIFRGEAGDVFGAIMVLHDVSELRRAAQFQSRLAAIVESSDDAIASKTPDGVVLSWNAGAARLFGYSAEEMIGRPITVIFPPELLSEEADFLGRIARGERIEHYETVRVRKDGRRVDVSVTLSPIKDSWGRVVGISKIARDISAQKRIERERAALLAREQQALRDSTMANRIKDEFLATLSHELRTPVNSILGWAELLGSGALGPAESSKALEVIARNARLQTQLIDELLDVSAITAGKVRLDVRPVDLSAVVQTALETLRPSAAIKRLEIETAIAAGGTLIMGDAARLQQVVWNLLNNALKFTPAGGRVRVELTRGAEFARLTITDTGVGIAPEALPSVFDRFRQADGGTTRRHGGLGLGLAIVRHLVELHGGSVWAESEGIGSGARFTVELALLRGHVHGVPAVAPQRIAAGSGDLGGRRVLVVDDDRDGRELVARVLTLAGADVTTADSAAGALEILERRSFDVVVADVGMPDMDGYRMLSEARTRGIATPAIAVTAFAREDNGRRGPDGGFARQLAKPVTADELVRAVIEVTAATSAPGSGTPAS